MQAITHLRTHRETLDSLRAELEAAREAEATARYRRVHIEERILAHPEVAAAITEEGTVTAGALKVTTGFTRTFDQAALGALAPTIEAAYWPFRSEYKEDRKASRVLEERFPELWAAIRPALTLKPRKPTVALAPVKGGA